MNQVQTYSRQDIRKCIMRNISKQRGHFTLNSFICYLLFATIILYTIKINYVNFKSYNIILIVLLKK